MPFTTQAKPSHSATSEELEESWRSHYSRLPLSLHIHKNRLLPDILHGLSLLLARGGGISANGTLIVGRLSFIQIRWRRRAF
jgi:hypothetical protein